MCRHGGAALMSAFELIFFASMKRTLLQTCFKCSADMWSHVQCGSSIYCWWPRLQVAQPTPSVAQTGAPHLHTYTVVFLKVRLMGPGPVTAGLF